MSRSPHQESKPKMLIKSITISAAIHIGLITSLILTPLVLKKKTASLLGKAPLCPLSEASLNESIPETRRALNDIFEEIIVTHAPTILSEEKGDAPIHALTTHPIAEQVQPVIQKQPHFSVEELSPPFSALTPVPIVKLEGDLCEQFDPFIKELKRDSAPLKAEIEWHNPLSDTSCPIALVAPAHDTHSSPAFPTEEYAPLKQNRTTPLPQFYVENEQMDALPHIDSYITNEHFSIETEIPSGEYVLPEYEVAYHAPSLSLSDYGLGEGIPIFKNRNHFTVAVSTLLRPSEKQKYFFSVTLTPSKSLNLPTLPQTITFALDRSSRVEKHAFNVYKKAVLKAISSLEEGTAFNLVLFDNREVRLSEKPLYASRENLIAAEKFLEKEGIAAVKSQSDLIPNIERITEYFDDSLNTIILLTDGKPLLKKKKTRSSIERFTHSLPKNISIYTAAVGQKEELIALDMLCAGAHGKLLQSDTYASFPRKLIRLVQGLHKPIATQLSIVPFKADKQCNVEIISTSSELPTLRKDAPLVVIGHSDQLEDFTLLIQGKHNNQWFNIHERISLKGCVVKHERRVERDIATQEARAYYGHYLANGDENALKKASALLKSTGNHIAFEN